MKKIFQGLAVVAMMVQMASCGLTEQLDKLSEMDSVQTKLNVSASVVSATVQINDLLKDIKMNGNGITTSSDGIFGFSYGFTMTQTIPPITIPNLPLSGALLTYDGTNFQSNSPNGTLSGVSMGSTLSSYKIGKMVLKANSIIDIAVTSTNNTLDKVTNLTVTFPSITKNSVALTKTFSLQANQAVGSIGTIDLTGYEVAFTNNMLASTMTLTAGANGNPTTPGGVTIVATLKDISYTQIQGYFGQVTIPALDNTQSLGMSLGEGMQGKIVIKGMEISIGANFTDGKSQVPIGLNFAGSQITYSNSTAPTSLSASGILFGTDGNKTVTISADGVDFLSMKDVKLTSTIKLNEGATTGDENANIITDNAALLLTTSVKVPISFQTVSMTISSKADNSFADMGDDLGDVNVTLTGTANSDLPIAVSIQVYFHDEETLTNYITADKLFRDKDLVESPISLAASASSSNINVTLNKARFDALKKYKYQTTVVTLLDNAQEGSLKNTQSVKLKLGIAGDATVKQKL